MKRKGPVTASDFLAQLENDPEYQVRRARQEEKQAKLKATLDADEKALVVAIREHGYDIDSVWDLVNNAPHPFIERRFVGPYPKAYPILVEHLAVPHLPRIREGIIRALTERDANEVASAALLREFESEADPELRWVLANALRTVLARSQKAKHPEYKAVFKNKNMP